MPVYRYQCVQCGEFDEWRSIHADPLERHHCGNVVARVYTVPALYGVGGRGERTREVDATERTWDRDRPAYKRFRDRGMQPRSVRGADRLEATAKGGFHVASGLPYTDAQAEAATTRAEEMAG